MVTISIIVPNYNHAKFLVERLDSVFNQTFQDFEVIILDDHSTDSSAEVINLYRDHAKLRCIVINEENSGNTFYQWKKGLQLAQGDFVWIAESDDFADRNFLQSLFDVAKESGAGIVYSDSMIVDEKSEALYRWSEVMMRFKQFNFWTKSFVMGGSALNKSVHALTNVIPNASSVIFKRDLVHQSCFDEILQYRYTGDWLFWADLFASTSVAYVHKPLNYFRSHQQTTRSVTRAKKRDLEEYYKCIKKLKNDFNLSAGKLFEENMKFLFEKWHYQSPVYFFRHWSSDRYKVAASVDPKINRRIASFLFSIPWLAAGRLFKKPDN